MDSPETTLNKTIYTAYNVKETNTSPRTDSTNQARGVEKDMHCTFKRQHMWHTQKSSVMLFFIFHLDFNLT